MSTKGIDFSKGTRNPYAGKKIRFGRVSTSRIDSNEPYTSIVANAVCKACGIEGGCLITDLSTIADFLPFGPLATKAETKGALDAINKALGFKVKPGTYIWQAAQKLRMLGLPDTLASK